MNGADRCKIAIQTNNVETDDRGYVYIIDRANIGIHILELTGEARAIAGRAMMRTPSCLISRTQFGPARAWQGTAGKARYARGIGAPWASTGFISDAAAGNTIKTGLLRLGQRV